MWSDLTSIQNAIKVTRKSRFTGSIELNCRPELGCRAERGDFHEHK